MSIAREKFRTAFSIRTPAFLVTTALVAVSFVWTGKASAQMSSQMSSQMSWPDQRLESHARMKRSARRAWRPPYKLPETPKELKAVAAAPKPQGPIIIAISIERQKLKLYDANGLFAESPVSTGTKTHPTPMGVFSVIQKNKYHRSNIYSSAPMPYMQRITWSGVAMHAGALPGYPASHGCIRLPMAFAMRLWGWTQMGARVIVSPGEVTPADIENVKLAARKPDTIDVAVAPAAPKADAATLVKSDKSQITVAQASDAAKDLKITSAPDAGDKSATVRTADASGGAPTVLPSSTPADDAAKDQAASKDVSRPSDSAAPAALAAPDPVVGLIGPVKPRTGHVAAYVSRKEGKLYVRQNFEPLFDVPLTIAPGDKPLGTHVFTMRSDKDDEKLYRWSVVSLPVRVSDKPLEQPSRNKKLPLVAEKPLLPPSSPAEALERANIPESAMQRIVAALAPGGSLIISDTGLGGETGRGTDFIVQLR